MEILMTSVNNSLRYKQIEHTGDIGIKIFGNSLEDIFINAAYGMFDVIADISNVNTNLIEEVEVAGDNHEELLVNWLSELNYLFITEHIIFNKFEITRLTDTELHAAAIGDRFDSRKHPLNTEIKAVTYHEIYVKQLKNKWEAQIIFDI